MSDRTSDEIMGEADRYRAYAEGWHRSWVSDQIYVGILHGVALTGFLSGLFSADPGWVLFVACWFPVGAAHFFYRKSRVKHDRFLSCIELADKHLEDAVLRAKDEFAEELAAFKEMGDDE